MSKQSNKGLAFSDATPEQVAAAKQIIDDAAKHRYYVSRIYGMYNTVTGKNEAPQTCSSCLRARAREISKWYEEGTKDVVQVTKKAKAKASKTSVDLTPKAEDLQKGAVQPDGTTVEDAAVAGLKDNPAVEETHPTADTDPMGYPAPAKGVTRIPMQEEGVVVDFTPNDGAKFENGVKGIAAYVDGKKVNAGTYKTAQGHTLKVQVGGKATYVEFDPNDLAS